MCLDVARCPRQQSMQPPAEDFYSLMSRRLATVGGLVAETALLECWLQQGREPRELSELLDGGRLCSLTRGTQRWVPAFLLHADSLTPRAEVATVADELAGGMDEEEILAWFVSSNALLDGETPIAMLRTSLPAVLDAARLDRFLHTA